MITKYLTYIKESIDIEDILIYLAYDVRDRFNSVKIKIVDSNIKNKDIIIYHIDRIVELYDDDSSRGFNYIVFQMKSQIEYYYFLFYFSYLLKNKYNNSKLSNAYVIDINKLTDLEFINILNTFFDYLKNNRIVELIEEYINKNNKIDDIILKCLDDEQKEKYQHILNANNFDLI